MRTAMIAALGLVLAAGVNVARADEKGEKKDVSVTGEVVDTFCYGTMGARGASHRQCGMDCAKKGIPVGLARRESLAWTGLWLLVLGTFGGVVAAATGLYAMEGVMVDPTVRERLLDVHERWMLATAALAAVLTGWALIARPVPRRGRLFFAFGLLALLAVMTKGADYGGRLVYDNNAAGSAS